MPYREARAILLAAAEPVETEKRELCACAGRVLAQKLTAACDVPPFDRSAFDGYVLRAEDTRRASCEQPITLRIMEEIQVSSLPRNALGPGEASKILTGAPIPPGGDAVVPYERTDFTEHEVTLYAPLRQGEDVVRKGEDVCLGAVLAEQGQRIDAGLMGSLAAQNIAEPLVFRQPRIGILSTGSELCEVGQPLLPGQIHDTNRYSLLALLTRLGIEPVLFGSVPDRLDEIEAAMDQALSACDALITTGGVSMGDYDLVPAAQEAIGAEILIRGVDLKPGMACCYARRDEKLLFGLSGNPTSSLTNLYVVALPALRRMCGLRECETKEFPVTLTEDFCKKSPINRLLRGFSDLRDGTVRLRLSTGQGNVKLSGLVGCDLAAMIPAGSGPVQAGTVLQGFFLEP